MQRSVAEAMTFDGVLLSHRIGRKVMPYLLKNQNECDHVTLIVDRCIAAGYLVRIRRGQFMMTASGVQWLNVDASLIGVGASNVANTP